MSTYLLIYTYCKPGCCNNIHIYIPEIVAIPINDKGICPKMGCMESLKIVIELSKNRPSQKGVCLKIGDIRKQKKWWHIFHVEDYEEPWDFCVQDFGLQTLKQPNFPICITKVLLWLITHNWKKKKKRTCGLNYI